MPDDSCSWQGSSSILSDLGIIPRQGSWRERWVDKPISLLIYEPTFVSHPFGMLRVRRKSDVAVA